MWLQRRSQRATLTRSSVVDPLDCYAVFDEELLVTTGLGLQAHPTLLRIQEGSFVCIDIRPQQDSTDWSHQVT